MYLSELKLWNFRKFGSNGTFDRSKPNLVIPFQKGLNLLVGENDSGKTAIIDAIKYILLTNSKEYIRLEIDDFYSYHQIPKDEKQILRIECHFKFNAEDNDSKAKNFLDWGHFSANGEFELRVFLEVEQTNGRIEPYDIRGGMGDEGIVLDARARELLRITYLKPLRDAKEELKPKKGSRLSQVLDSHSTFAEKDNHFLAKTVKLANQEIANFFKGANSHHHTLLDEIRQILAADNTLLPQIEEKFNPHLHNSGKKGDELANQINAYLSYFFGTNTTSLFQISETKLKGILERLSLHLDSINAGLGSHNLLFIAVELLLLEKENDFTGLRLALIEEIEAHLHPQAQMRLVEYLQKECESKNIQMLLTTHSPNLASKVKLENLIICQDNYAYPMGSDYTMLEKGDYAFLERFLDVTKANLFFAKGVILVEGDAENLLLPTIAKIIDCDLTQSGVSVVKIGNTAFNRYESIFLRQAGEDMKIPVAVITDLDQKPQRYYHENPDKMPKNYRIEISKIQEFKTITPCTFDVVNLEGEYKTIAEIHEKISAIIPRGFGKKAKDFFNSKSGNLTLIDIEVSDLDVRKRQILLNKEKQSQKNIRYCVAQNWTLEYEIGLSDLRELFYKAICLAKKTDWFDESLLADLPQFLVDFPNAADPNEKENTAYRMYWEIMMNKSKNEDNKGLSKATVAHFFAEILEMEMKGIAKKSSLQAQIEADPHLTYLVNAIKHATSKL